MLTPPLRSAGWDITPPVFQVHLVGNMFVIAAVLSSVNMRTVTNLFIVSLACADLMIVVFSVPATAMNSVLNEWHMGDALCKLSIWVQAATTGASVYTLVAVTADRYIAICHSMHYNRLRRAGALCIITLAWLTSALIFSPLATYSRCTEHVVDPDLHITATICRPEFGSILVERAFFLVVNVLAAFLVPLAAITILYVRIFGRIYGREVAAVDHAAGAREQRMRYRAAVMMLSVIALFVMCWAPLYTLYFYMYFVFEPGAHDTLATDTLRPIFQWLSLANSCINPIIYATFSSTFRTAFQRLCYTPFTDRYNTVRTYTMRRFTRQSGSDDTTKYQAYNAYGRCRSVSQPGGRLVQSMKISHSYCSKAPHVTSDGNRHRRKYASEKIKPRCRKGVLQLQQSVEKTEKRHGRTRENVAHPQQRNPAGIHQKSMQIHSSNIYKIHRDKLSMPQDNWQKEKHLNFSSHSSAPPHRKRVVKKHVTMLIPKLKNGNVDGVVRQTNRSESPMFCSDTPPPYSPPPPPE